MTSAAKNNKNNLLDLQSKMLQRGKMPVQQKTGTIPVSEMAIVLTLDQIMPNPDNPRTSKNPKYEEIKASIRARGLDTVPKVTKDPDSDKDIYIFSDGGNTRYSILRELWAETADNKFYNIQCIVKPWPGRLKCLIGHLTENEMRGSLTFIEKALAVKKAKDIHEAKLGREIPQSELSDLLKIEGYPTQQSNISRMFQTINELYPYLNELLHAGLGRPQIINLLTLKSNARNAYGTLVFSNPSDTEKPDFETIFASVCSEFYEIENYSFDIFKELLLEKLSELTTEYTYDDWVIAVDRDTFSAIDLERITNSSFNDSKHELNQNINKQSIVNTQEKVETIEKISKEPIKEKQISNVEEISSPNLANVGEVNTADMSNIQPKDSVNKEINEIVQNNDYNEPHTSSDYSTDIWTISFLKDDLEHLQLDAFKLAFNLLDKTDSNTDSIDESFGTFDVGFSICENDSEMAELLNSLASNKHININKLLIGDSHYVPLFSDEVTLMIFRLIRVVRRIRELQRLESTYE